MPLPPEVTTRTLHGSYPDVDGTPRTGTVNYRALITARYPDIDLSIPYPEYSAALVNGEFTIAEVLTGDDPLVEPQGFRYREYIVFDSGETSTRWVFISKDDGDPIEVSDLSDDFVFFAGPGQTGPRGPKGDQGPPGSGSNFIHFQTTPSSTWIVDHNMNNYVGVACYNSADELVIPEVQFNSMDSITLTFPTPVTGKVVCS